MIVLAKLASPLTAALLLSPMLFLLAPRSNSDPLPTDAQIEKAALFRLRMDDGVADNSVDVSVKDGVVTLRGSVPNLLSRERAPLQVERLRGVRAVRNLLVVRPSGREDAQITHDILRAFALDPAVDLYEVKVNTLQGTVALTGTVDSWTEKRLAESVATGVYGVVAIDNRIAVKAAKSRPDSEIEADVRRTLQWDARVDDGLIDVEVKDGQVTLKGVAGSAREKRQATRDAYVAGVREVDSRQLEVEHWARLESLRGEKLETTSEQIKEALTLAYLYDPRVQAFQPEIVVDDGIVSLFGTVDNLAAKRAAEQLARSTTGVWEVRNLLKVRPKKPVDDATLQRLVNDRLGLDPRVSRREILVNARNGMVYLYGTIDSDFERRRAEQIAGQVAGVVDVRNRLEVIGARSVRAKNDAVIKHDINAELYWSPFVDHEDIAVTVQDGVATLTGTVESVSERMSAMQNALEGGALQVDNRLKVENGPEALR